MPLYEYYCSNCHGVFELLRPAGRASEAQPCPDCDAECPRLMPTSVNAFILRDGIPRRLPDRGRFWHHGKEVSAPISRTVVMGEHPELVYDRLGPEQPATVEEQEAFAERQRRQAEATAEMLARGEIPPSNIDERRQTEEFVQRARRTAGAARLKRRRAPNADITPRTRSGSEGPSSDA
ncbi:MAG: FmdB family zinc ribbon protein [Dehalococcoidia bacterium]